MARNPTGECEECGTVVEPPDELTACEVCGKLVCDACLRRTLQDGYGVSHARCAKCERGDGTRRRY